MDFLSTMKAKAKADKKVIVLPESYEKRNLEAAAECLKEELADIVLIGKKDKIMEAAGSFDVSKAIFVDPETYDRMDEMVAGLAEARKSKGMTLEARKILMDDSLCLLQLCWLRWALQTVWFPAQSIPQQIH